MDVSAEVFGAKGYNSWVEDAIRNVLRQLLVGDLRQQLIGAGQRGWTGPWEVRGR